MLTIRSPTDIHSIPDPGLRRLVQRRYAEIMNGEPFDPDIHGEIFFIPKPPGIDAPLLSMCAQFAKPAIEPVPP